MGVGRRDRAKGEEGRRRAKGGCEREGSDQWSHGVLLHTPESCETEVVRDTRSPFANAWLQRDGRVGCFAWFAQLGAQLPVSGLKLCASPAACQHVPTSRVLRTMYIKFTLWFRCSGTRMWGRRRSTSVRQTGRSIQERDHLEVNELHIQSGQERHKQHKEVRSRWTRCVFFSMC